MMHFTECPRDAMQGLLEFVPTKEKVEYINSLLQVGFDVIDAGSFVSPKAIPQLADTAAVFNQIDWNISTSKILAIIANQRGADEAVKMEMVDYIGFPFSVSETFQLRNTNSSILQSLQTVESIQSLAVNNNKQLRVYLSMAFGNPYGDKWNAEVVYKWLQKMLDLGITDIALADTTGVSDAATIKQLFGHIVPQLPQDVKLSAHLHAPFNEVKTKVSAAWEAGCRHFDTAFKGFGGCPMASDALTGNTATELVYDWCKSQNIETNINELAFDKAERIAISLFERYH
jgi:hydroxymethylglutaryl-CoA lyase